MMQSRFLSPLSKACHLAPTFTRKWKEKTSKHRALPFSLPFLRSSLSFSRAAQEAAGVKSKTELFLNSTLEKLQNISIEEIDLRYRIADVFHHPSSDSAVNRQLALWDTICQRIKGAKHIRLLHIQGNDLGLAIDAPAVIQSIASCIAHLPHLHTVNLSANHLTDADVAVICQSMLQHKSVTNLFLYANQIGDEGAGHIADAISHGLGINFLELSFNAVGSKGAVRLALALQKRRMPAVSTSESPTWLYLCSNQIGTPGVEALLSVLPARPQNFVLSENANHSHGPNPNPSTSPVSGLLVSGCSPSEATVSKSDPNVDLDCNNETMVGSGGDSGLGSGPWADPQLGGVFLSGNYGWEVSQGVDGYDVVKATVGSHVSRIDESIAVEENSTLRLGNETVDNGLPAGTHSEVVGIPNPSERLEESMAAEKKKVVKKRPRRPEQRVQLAAEIADDYIFSGPSNLEQLLPSDWARALEPFDALSNQLSVIDSSLEDFCSQGIEIYPKREEIFNALKLCPFKEVRVVIIGQDPYPTRGCANGLAFSNLLWTPTNSLSPSLKNIFKEVKSNLQERGVSWNFPSSGDLTPWARQGVLLLNASLTFPAVKIINAAEKQRVLRQHRSMWHPVTQSILRALIGRNESPIVFMLWGKDAQRLAMVLDSNLMRSHGHKVLIAPHPSPMAKGFLGCGHFNDASDFLMSMGEDPIDWAI